MSALATFFDQNEALIRFSYGLVFFVMGLAILIQGRSTSRLELARSMVWLGAFGITHGLHEWGDLFIPIQATYTPAAIIRLLYVLHLVLLSLSFACLLQFGVSLLNTLGRARWLRTVPLILFGVWFIATFVVLPALLPEGGTWYRISNALARYFMGFPGGLLSAYGLRQHAQKRIAPLNVPAIHNTLRIAGIALALYAIFGGLIPPVVPFPPGNMLNTASFEQWTGFPPMVFRSVIGLVMAVAVIRGMEVFEVQTQRRIEELEQQTIISAERERLARTLHDGAIQKVYTAGLLVESAARLTDGGGELSSRLLRAQVILNDSIADLRRNLSELEPASTSESPLLAAELQRIAADPRYAAMVQTDLSLGFPVDARLTAIRTEHLVAILNEAMANIVRHAHARTVQIRAAGQGEALCIAIADDGVGLPPETASGYGLRNMHDRARLLNGSLSIHSERGKGTRLTIQIPWTDENG